MVHGTMNVKYLTCVTRYIKPWIMKTSRNIQWP